MTADLSAWIGRRLEAADCLDPARSRGLLGALGHDAGSDDGEALPPLHHWLYFWDVRPPAELGGDGHPALGGFMPPVELPRRMWAGSRVEFLAPLPLGEPARRVSTILNIEAKSGRSGDLVFVTVGHEVFGAAGLAIREAQDVVYRGAPSPGAAQAAPPPAQAQPADWRRRVDPDPVLLFRYSALTMNGHRIHYDRPYATGVEGYPGLVVHGPLQATLMVALAAANLSAPITRFHFRGLAPAFEGSPLSVEGASTADGAELWVEQGGRRCMSGGVSCGEHGRRP